MKTAFHYIFLELWRSYKNEGLTKVLLITFYELHLILTSSSFEVLKSVIRIKNYLYLHIHYSTRVISTLRHPRKVVKQLRVFISFYFEKNALRTFTVVYFSEEQSPNWKSYFWLSVCINSDRSVCRSVRLSVCHNFKFYFQCSYQRIWLYSYFIRAYKDSFEIIWWMD